MTPTPSTGVCLLTSAAVLTATGAFLLYTGLHSAGTPPSAIQTPLAAMPVGARTRHHHPYVRLPHRPPRR